jgi:hypothetical protein
MRVRGKRAPGLPHQMKFQFLRLSAVALTAAGALVVGGTAAAEPVNTADSQPDGIAFVHLRISERSAEALGTKVTPGRLKPTPERIGGRIALEVVSRDGKPLWRGSVDDPALEKLETGERGDLPRIIAAEVQRDVVETTVRVPFFEDRQVVRFSRIKPSATSEATVTPLGSVVIQKQ